MVTPLIRGVGRIARRFGPEDLPSMLRPSLPWEAPPPGVARAVEPALDLPGIRRARPVPDPQDVNFLNPRLQPPPSPFPLRPARTPFEEDPVRSWEFVRDEPFQITPRNIPGAEEITFTPFSATQVASIEEMATADRSGTFFGMLQMLDEVETPADLAYALQVTRAGRLSTGGARELDDALNIAISRAARKVGIEERAINPIYYENSPALPRQVSRVGSELEEVTEASATSNQFRIDTNKAIKNAKRSADLDDIDTTNGGVVGRALASGEINEMDAKRLIDQTNYTRVRLLQNEGILPKGLNNNVRAKGGKRGIDLLDNMSELSDVNKARLYKVAIQTAETNDEVAQVYALAVGDLKSPALLDELESVLDGKAAYFGRIEGIVPDRLARPVETTVDEAAIRQANAEQAAFDARRANADETRPAFPSDEVDSEDTIVNAFLATDKEGKKQFVRTRLGDKEKWVRTENGERVPVTLGGGTGGRLVDTSLSVAPPDPVVPLGSSSMTPPYEMNSGGYLPRTIANAQEGDITIAIASDFSTGGEKLTAASAKGMRRAVKNSAGKWEAEYGRPGDFGRINEIEQIPHLSPDLDSHATSIVNKLNRISAEQGRPVVINGAGNGLASLSSQAEADAYARHVINRIVNHPDRAFEIDYVVTGGQNGYDIAIAKAAKAYGIPIKINPAYSSNGSIMLQDPTDAKKIIFMSRNNYIRRYRLDTGDIGESSS